MTDKLKQESGAFYYTLGWMSATYFSSTNKEEKQGIASMFRDLKHYYTIETSESLNNVIKAHYGSEQI